VRILTNPEIYEKRENDRQQNDQKYYGFVINQYRYRMNIYVTSSEFKKLVMIATPAESTLPGI
jgi:hypothetical protein